MFTNDPNALDVYPYTGWWLEWIPRKREKETDSLGNVTVTEIEGYFSTTPKVFRYRFKNMQGELQQEVTPITGRSSIDVGALLETKSKYGFKKEDLILSDLEKYPNEQLNKLGLPYVNFSRISKVDKMIVESDSKVNLMFKTGNEIVKEITIG